MSEEAEESLRFNIVCGMCGLLLDSFTLDELAFGTWNEGSLWGVVADAAHRPNCPRRAT